MDDPVTETLLSGRDLDALTLRDWVILRRTARLVGHTTLARVEAEMAKRGILGPDGKTRAPPGPQDADMRWLFEAHGRLERGEPVDDLFGPDGEPLIPGGAEDGSPGDA